MRFNVTGSVWFAKALKTISRVSYHFNALFRVFFGIKIITLAYDPIFEAYCLTI